MRCRHTVPDWHRFAAEGVGAPPIFAACRLLIKEGERVSDPRSIACAYWGHQEDCPLYEGPGKRQASPANASAIPVPTDKATKIEDVWPVRRPGAADAPRIMLIALSAVSAGLLTWAAILGLTAHGGVRSPEGFRYIVATGIAISIVTHILAMLRIWARR
jgi:hypothetical protein